MKRVLDGRLWLLPLTVGVVVLLGPWWGADSTTLRTIMIVSIYALVVSGINLVWGYAGELAVGHIAMYAAGAYMTGALSRHGVDMALSLLASIAVAAALGLVTAIPGLRLSGWGLAMSSFFLVALIPDVIRLLPEDTTGGDYGMLGIPDPKIFGQVLTPNGYYVLVVASLIAWIALMRNFVVSRHGTALQVVRDSPRLAQSLGYNIPRLKAMTYVLGAIPAGVAGWLFVYLDRYIAPEYFSFTFAIMIIASSVLGGVQTVYGAVIGVLVLRLGTDNVAVFEKYSFIAYGLFMLVGGLLFASPWFNRILQKVRKRTGDGVARTVPAPSSTDAAPSTRSPMDSIRGPLLETVNLSRAFGGVQALRDVTFTARPGEVTALIGANGSGKTTLLNIICGYYTPDVGVVNVDGATIPPGRPHVAGRRGVSRTFQTPIMPVSLSVKDVVAAARYRSAYVGWLPTMLRLPNYRRTAAQDDAQSVRWLSAVGIGHLVNDAASELPLGSRRLVEVARALASEGGILLMDEPASGLEAGEVQQLADLLDELRTAGATVVLVEHNFDMVCDVADRIYVLERGEVLAVGTPDEIRSSEAVARSYLGTAPPLAELSNATQGEETR